MNHSLNSLKGIRKGTTMGVIKGDTRSLDCSSYGDDTGVDSGSMEAL